MTFEFPALGRISGFSQSTMYLFEPRRPWGAGRSNRCTCVPAGGNFGFDSEISRREAPKQRQWYNTYSVWKRLRSGRAHDNSRRSRR